MWNRSGELNKWEGCKTSQRTEKAIGEEVVN